MVMAGGHRVIIFGFLPQNFGDEAVAMAFSMAWLEAGVESPASGDLARGVLAAFRGELYGCLAARADALFELADGAPRGAVVPQRLAEAITSFGLDALAGAVPLNVDLDVVLSVLASTVCAALRRRLPGYQTATPDTLQRRFLNTGGIIENDHGQTTIRLARRTYSPVLRQASLAQDDHRPLVGRPDPPLPVRLIRLGANSPSENRR